MCPVNVIVAIMSDYPSHLKPFIHHVEEAGIVVHRETHGFTNIGTDLVFPYLIVTLCLRGSGRALYDMIETTQSKNDIAVILPGHIMRPLDYSEDFTYATLNISKKLFTDLRTYLFSHDYEKFNASPMSHLTDIQAQRLLSIMDLLDAISQHSFEDLDHRQEMLVSQLSVGYEFINFYRKEQDKIWKENRHKLIYKQFCDLVVSHYKESKDIQYYANLLGVHPKLLNRIVREETHNLSAKTWIEQYVVAQIKHFIGSQPKRPIKFAAYELGFTEPSALYRYFKRVTGMTANEYRDKVKKASASKTESLT